MKTICCLLLVCFWSGCAYDGPMITVSVGFNGISAGVTLGSPTVKASPAGDLPTVKGLAK